MTPAARQGCWATKALTVVVVVMVVVLVVVVVVAVVVVVPLSVCRRLILCSCVSRGSRSPYPFASVFCIPIYCFCSAVTLSYYFSHVRWRSFSLHSGAHYCPAVRSVTPWRMWPHHGDFCMGHYVAPLTQLETIGV